MKCRVSVHSSRRLPCNEVELKLMSKPAGFAQEVFATGGYVPMGGLIMWLSVKYASSPMSIVEDVSTNSVQLGGNLHCHSCFRLVCNLGGRERLK